MPEEYEKYSSGSLMMCARFVFRNLHWHWKGFAPEAFPDFPGSYNIAPTDYSLVVRRFEGRYCFWPMRWGLVPPWAKDSSMAARCINARMETVSDRASFRGAIKYHRCIVPADGFYEWQGVKGYKQPYFIYRSDNQLLGFAGIFSEWESPAGVLETFSILTTESNREMSDIHNRMPVILEPRDMRAWLDPAITEYYDLRKFMFPAIDGTLTMHQVGKLVGNPRVEGSDLIKRLC